MIKILLANAAGVSLKTLQRWISNPREELLLLGVKERDRLLPPVVVTSASPSSMAPTLTPK